MAITKLLFGLSVFVLSSVSLAADPLESSIEEAFNNSPLVQSSKMALLGNFPRLTVEETKIIFLSGICGVVGCDNRVLVVQTFSEQGSSAQYESISALVNAPAAGPIEVLKVIDWDTEVDSTAQSPN